jgi:hypothetical protein
MSRAADIIYMDEYHESFCETQDYIEFVHELISSGYERYKADMRISGLYYRTSSVDVNSMYKVTRFTEYAKDCDIRNIYEAMKQKTSNHKENLAFLDKLDEAFEVLENETPPLYEYPFSTEHHLKFKREPENNHDGNAIQILYKGKLCGYVPKEHAAVLVRKYSTIDIERAYGIIRQKVGDARVTFDMYLQNNKKVERYIEEEDDTDDWEEDDIEVPIKKKPVKNIIEEEDDDVEPINEAKPYQGETRQHPKHQYLEEYRDGKWEPWDNTWWFNGEKIVKWVRALQRWEEVTAEEQAKNLKEFDQRQKQIEEPKVATTAFVSGAVTNLAAPGTIQMTVNGGMQMFDGNSWMDVAPLASPVFTGKPMKAAKVIPQPLDYTQYTGFLRTVLEYATFAHVK